jgi:hypothetical protein
MSILFTKGKREFIDHRVKKKIFSRRILYHEVNYTELEIFPSFSYVKVGGREDGKGKGKTRCRIRCRLAVLNSLPLDQLDGQQSVYL